MNSQPGRLDFIVLFALGALWGSSFGAIKVALQGVSPISVMAIRIILGCLTLLLVILVRKSALPKGRENWLMIFTMGFVGTVMPFYLIAWGQKEVDSSLASILMAVNPLFALAMGHFFSENEKFDFRKLLAMMIGISGVMLVFGEKAIDSMGENVYAQLAIITGGIGYVISGVIVVRIKNVAPDALSFSVFLSSSAMVFPLWLILDQPFTQEYSLDTLFALTYLGVVTTGIAFLMRYFLIIRNGAVFFSFVAYLIPMFGIIYGFIFFDEQITLLTLLAVALILSGIYLGRKAKQS